VCSHRGALFAFWSRLLGVARPGRWQQTSVFM
jgi:hypothetical protein